MVKFETLDPEIRGVLGKKVSELGLKVEGSPVEGYVRELYKEVERRGLKKFRPVCYLTDEWGCPDQQPVLGIPFYLADAKLRKLEKAVDALESERQIMMYMRHEAGHVFNYAYRLYTTPEWRRLFGPFFRPYRDEYRPVPFSRHYVRHIEGWYAQKHPDEDFAETFAVWMTPRSAWKKRYAGWPALKKLEYVDRMARELANKDPTRPLAKALAEMPVEEMATSLEDFYRETIPDEQRAISDLVPDGELEDIFTAGPAREGLAPAGTVLAAHAKTLTDKITYWTGIRRSLAKKLVETIVRRSRDLELFVDRSREAEQLLDMTVLATTLAMNYLQRGKFDEK